MSVAPPPLPSAISSYGNQNSQQNGLEQQKANDDKDTSVTEDATSGGIIYPPAHIRVIADKTAQWVASSGSGAQLEERLRQSEKNNAKFCFLNPTDYYHAYYLHKIKEVKAGIVPKQTEAEVEVQTKVEEDVKGPPEEPPALEFMTPMPSVSAQDLDILRLTAQFVARNGRQFMVSLAQREGRNYQFDFLRPNHSLFNYFSKLVEQYTKILVPTPTMLEKIEARASDKYSVQEIVMKRVEYTAYQQELQKRRDEKEDAERQAFLSINWQDFVVVETIEFTEADEAMELPVPKSLKELENMSLAQKRMMQVLAETEQATPNATGGQDGPQDIEVDFDDDVDMEDSDDEENDVETSGGNFAEVSNANEIVMTAPQLTTQMKIKEDFVPKAFKGRTAAALKEATQLCPRCGQQIEISKMDEHVKIELLDPRWKEQREQAEAKNKASNMVSDGTDVVKSLNMLKAHRPDIFISEEEQQRVTEEERKRRIEKEISVWDGQSSTAALTAQRNAAAAAAAAAALAVGQSPYPLTQQQQPTPPTIGPQTGRDAKRFKQDHSSS
ncbi:SF3a splicing factor complex subunit [Lunasporangiospora selenospora]|uniref:SF3a splicing factor complex subunit n=1 Tax=Lunasporangiospora selenospora TaxID=979761 RepID=A0A9P6FVV0_9FUNG|nr:SF3a splicing factor complex subunit [Lunasporangiospora selenospora]